MQAIKVCRECKTAQGKKPHTASKLAAADPRSRIRPGANLPIVTAAWKETNANAKQPLFLSCQSAGHFLFNPAEDELLLKFVAISDTHCRHRNLKLPKGDVLLHAGDISYRSNRQEIVDFLDWFGRLPFRYKIFIAGNHDFFFEKESPSMVMGLLPETVFYLKDEGINIEGIRVWGSPYTPWYYRWAFNKRRGESMRKHWDLIPTGTDVLLTHGPVYGILDTLVNDQHAGDIDLLRRVLTVKPRVHVCGHIHEAYGSVKRHGIQFINASMLNEAFELANKPLVFEVKASPVLLSERAD